MEPLTNEEREAFAKLALETYLDALNIRKKGLKYMGDVNEHDIKDVHAMCAYLKEELLVELTPDDLISKVKRLKFLYDCGKVIAKEKGLYVKD